MDERTVILWGDIGAGKTSLLATALLGPGADARLPMVDWPTSLRAVQDALLPAYQRLTNCLPTAPTSHLPPAVALRLTNGSEIRLQDVMGEHVRRPDHVIRDLLGRAVAVLFVMAWGRNGRRQQFDSIRTALPALGNRPRALAFTRCEQVVADGHPAWRPGGELSEWWAEFDTWDEDERDTLRRIGPVWATSAFGFDPDGDPACIHDEFGDLVPYDIRPRNGTALLASLFGRLT